MREPTTVVITQSNYLPWKGYFDLINSADICLLYDDVQYTRRDWRNRNRIMTPTGVQWLTIPVYVKGRFTQRINETAPSDSDWAAKHWKTIQLSYRKAPYFDLYCKELEQTFKECAELTTLSEINRTLLERLCGFLGIRTSFRWSSEFDCEEGRTKRLVSLCEAVGATRYISGPSAQAYIEEGLFREANIELEYYSFANYAPYEQLSDDFVHEVTILDLLFNVGPKSTNYMKSFAGLDD